MFLDASIEFLEISCVQKWMISRRFQSSSRTWYSTETEWIFDGLTFFNNSKTHFLEKCYCGKIIKNHIQKWRISITYHWIDFTCWNKHFGIIISTTYSSFIVYLIFLSSKHHKLNSFPINQQNEKMKQECFHSRITFQISSLINIIWMWRNTLLQIEKKKWIEFFK